MAMKIKSDRVKEKQVKKVSKTTKLLLMLGLFVLVIIGLNVYTSMTFKATVDIVKLNTSVPQDGVVNESMMYKDSMSKTEYEKQGVYTTADGSKRRAIMLWDDRGTITKTSTVAYASYYVRQDTPLYWDSLSKETPKQNSYLYQMDGELLKLELDADQFGGMLVPGDKINVRVTYDETDYSLPSESEFLMQQQLGIAGNSTTKVSSMLFNNVTVLDILNGSGDSIFDLYYKLLALPKAQQQEVVNSEDFKMKVEPQEILLNVTPEEADNYMSVTNKSPKYLMTLLPRTSGNLITEALSELEIGFQRGN